MVLSYKPALPKAQNPPDSNQQEIGKADQLKYSSLLENHLNEQLGQEKSPEAILATSPITSSPLVYITPSSGCTSSPDVQLIQKKAPIDLLQSPTYKRALLALLKVSIYINQGRSELDLLLENLWV
jgi:hypothetical protein